jgi:NAD(P)-dependent dehydrogenase (short-subunit alcohol dehydrogenase family)
MRAARFGRIINITSLVTRVLAFRPSYAAAKAALESITRTMAIELAADGITGNAVAPGPTETAVHLLGVQRLAPPSTNRT